VLKVGLEQECGEGMIDHKKVSRVFWLAAREEPPHRRSSSTQILSPVGLYFTEREAVYGVDLAIGKPLILTSKLGEGRYNLVNGPTRLHEARLPLAHQTSKEITWKMNRQFTST
jgi:hypothetical protein